MASGTGLALWLLMMAVFFYVLYLVVRAAVEEAIRRALPQSLLEPQARERQRAAEDDPHAG